MPGADGGQGAEAAIGHVVVVIIETAGAVPAAVVHHGGKEGGADGDALVGKANQNEKQVPLPLHTIIALRSPQVTLGAHGPHMAADPLGGGSQSPAVLAWGRRIPCGACGLQGTTGLQAGMAPLSLGIHQQGVAFPALGPTQEFIPNQLKGKGLAHRGPFLPTRLCRHRQGSQGWKEQGQQKAGHGARKVMHGILKC